jgi:hypothetical protein
MKAESEKSGKQKGRAVRMQLASVCSGLMGWDCGRSMKTMAKVKMAAGTRQGRF